MNTTLRDVDEVDVAADVEHSPHEVLDVQRDVATIVLRTRQYDTKVVARRDADGAWRLRCEPVDGEPYTLVAPVDMPYLTLIRMLEIL